MSEIRVDYIDHMGSDLTVANAARVSFDKESDWDTVAVDRGLGDFDIDIKLSDRDTKLITFLATHNHWTPFGHPQITLRETVPIFVARQRFKHTVGFVYNEVSRRYVDSPPEFYVPKEWRKRAENKKQGSSDETIDFSAEAYIHPDKWGCYGYNEVVQCCVNTYNMMLAKGIAPEMARMVLPQSMFTSYYVTGSLAAFARLYKLRTDDHAQKEIQDLAEKIGAIIEPLYPCSWKALVS